MREVAGGRAQLGRACDAAGVAGDGGEDGGVDDLIGAAARHASDDDARDEPLHIPLPRRPCGFIEVVEVEHQSSFGRGVEPEVRHVGVAAGGDEDAAVRRIREVGGHQRRGTAIEREGTRRHAFGSQGEQLGDAGAVLCGQDAEGIARAAREFSEGASWRALSGLLAAFEEFAMRQRACPGGEHEDIVAGPRARSPGPHAQAGSSRSTSGDSPPARSSAMRRLRARSSSAPISVPKRSLSLHTAVRVTRCVPVSQV